MKYWIGNIYLVYSNFTGKNDEILLKMPAFCELQGLTELIFWSIFLVQYIYIKRIFWIVYHFF